MDTVSTIILLILLGVFFKEVNMKIVGLLFLIILWIGIAVPVEGDSDLQELHWLKGQWKGQLGKNTYYESWKPINHGTLEGSASMVNPQVKTILTEVLRIDKIGSHVVYIAAVKKNHPVYFILTVPNPLSAILILIKYLGCWGVGVMGRAPNRRWR